MNVDTQMTTRATQNTFIDENIFLVFQLVHWNLHGYINWLLDEFITILYEWWMTLITILKLAAHANEKFLGLRDKRHKQSEIGKI